MRKTRGPERMRRQGNRTSSRCTELGKETAHQPDLHYVEGWRVIAEANRNFGYDVWDRRRGSASIDPLPVARRLWLESNDATVEPEIGTVSNQSHLSTT